MTRNKKFFFPIFTLLLTLTLLSIPLAGFTQQIKFISIADIHFDPFTVCSKKIKKCPGFEKLKTADIDQWPTVFEKYELEKESAYKDTNYRVFKTSLKEMKKTAENEHPLFVIILGDFLSHEIRKDFYFHSYDKSARAYDDFIKKVFQFLQSKLALTFPEISLYPVIGNNDSYNGDYVVLPQGRFFQDMTAIWLPSIKEKNNQESFVSSFPFAGFYELNLPSYKGKILVLNSVVFSVNAKTKPEVAKKQFEWLSEKLKNADTNKERVILAYHIPIGIDVYSTFQKKLNAIAQFWKASYTDLFETLLAQYRVVSVILSGHVHMDSIQAITLKQFRGVPVNITPSISPIFGNDPAYKVITLEVPSLDVDSTETITTPLSHLTEVNSSKRKWVC